MANPFIKNFNYITCRQNNYLHKVQMVLEKMLTQLSLPESLSKYIEEWAGIYRPTDYKNLRDSLQSVCPKRWGGKDSRNSKGRRVFPAEGALAMYCSKKWVDWQCENAERHTWYVFLKILCTLTRPSETVPDF